MQYFGRNAIVDTVTQIDLIWTVEIADLKINIKTDDNCIFDYNND